MLTVNEIVRWTAPLENAAETIGEQGGTGSRLHGAADHSIVGIDRAPNGERTENSVATSASRNGCFRWVIF